MSESPASLVKSPIDAAASRDRMLGLGLIFASFVVALGVSWLAKEAAMPRLALPPAPPSTTGIDGFPSAVAPLAVFETAKALTVRDKFVGMALSSVKADGTIDVTNGGSARFVFRSEEGEGPEPEREYGTLAARRYCGFQVVALDQSGLGAKSDVSDADCKRAIEPLPPPACKPAALWDLGKQKGADATQTATIEYYRAGSGPAWFFQSGETTLWLAGDCATELAPAQSQGVAGKRVPG